MVRANGKWQMANGFKKLHPTPYTLHPSRGFTLLELLVVIAVIGILASMFIGVYGQSQKRGRDGERKFELNELKVALEQYHADHQHYPISANYAAVTTLLTSAGERDLKVVPVDPSMPGGTNYFYRPLLADGQTTCTVGTHQPIQCQDYIVCALLENTTDADITGAPPRHACFLQDGTTNPTGGTHNFGYRAP